MEASKNLKRTFSFREMLICFAFMLFDIFAVNFSYFIALVIRFYFDSEFNSYGVKYIPAFQKIAPWYTVACLIIFCAFKLYNNRWRYSGLNDFNRIVAACVVTCVVQVLGSAVFVMRMPMTYYFLGAGFQLALIVCSRFAYRLLLMERSRINSRKDSGAVPVMIVGVGVLSHQVRRHLESDAESAARPACIVDFRCNESGDLLDGLPVIKGIEHLPKAIKKYGIACVILADNTIPQEVRRSILDICVKQKVEVQDFAGYFQETFGRVTLRNLMEYVEGGVELVIDGKKQSYSSGKQAANAVTGKYLVKSISTSENSLVVELQRDILIPNNVKEEWVLAYEKETGEEISFF